MKNVLITYYTVVCDYLYSLARGAGTVSGQGGQTVLQKIWHDAPKKFFFSLPTLVFSLSNLDLIIWVGKDPPAIA